ncbi:MAG: hypothetical protein HY318_20220 [Armatimonadetes bacterium]|nr:hypothetical protein [Armatimonadota bacterium]
MEAVREQKDPSPPGWNSLFGSVWEWTTVVALLIYSLVVCLMRGLGWVSSTSIPIFASLPCLGAAAWFGCLFVTHRETDFDWGLVLTSLGWVAAGMTFLAVAGANRGGNTAYAWVWGWLTVVLILSGGIAAWLSVQGEQAEGSLDEPQEG